MSGAEEPDGREHEGDEYVTYSRRKGRRDRPNFPPFPPSSEEEEEALREAERRASARQSAKQRRGLVTGMSDQRAAVRPQQIQT
jgi:hypothetical protein